MPSEPSVGVVGAGVVGLHTARVFAERGHAVTVYAAAFTPDTTSDLAAALILPHLVPATPLVLDALERSCAYYAELVSANVGVRPCTLTLAADSPDELAAEVLPFAASFPTLAALPEDAVPGGYRYGWRLATWLVDSRAFMPYLVERVRQLGVRLEARRFTTRAEVLALPHPILANCSGLGARELFDDAAVYPVKGQLVDVRPSPLDAPIIHGQFCVFPRGDGAVLGGSHEEGVADDAPDERLTAAIVAGNRRVAPSLTSEQVIGARAGPRPCRAGGPRIEAETVGDRRLLHNYGHGGSGWTLAPGAAELLAALT